MLEHKGLYWSKSGTEPPGNWNLHETISFHWEKQIQQRITLTSWQGIVVVLSLMNGVYWAKAAAGYKGKVETIDL
jgi:hypothetical protein